MRTSIAFLTFSFFGSITHAHSATGHLIINGVETGLWQHVLDVALGVTDDRPIPEGNQFYKVVPQWPEDLGTSNITCGRNAFASLEKTEIANVVAGQEIGFRNMQPEEGGDSGIPGYFFHNGPAQIWMSRAPNDDLKSYKGTGDWFKVGYAGPKNNTHWKLQGTKDFNFTLPATTPPGAYLLRFELIMPTTTRGNHQWYINCALINVQSPPNTTPGVPTGFLKFPAEGGKWPYDKEDPGLWLSFVLGGGIPQEQMRLMEYKPPGPAVWTG